MPVYYLAAPSIYHKSYIRVPLQNAQVEQIECVAETPLLDLFTLNNERLFWLPLLQNDSPGSRNLYLRTIFVRFKETDVFWELESAEPRELQQALDELVAAPGKVKAWFEGDKLYRSHEECLWMQKLKSAYFHGNMVPIPYFRELLDDAGIIIPDNLKMEIESFFLWGVNSKGVFYHLEGPTCSLAPHFSLASKALCDKLYLAVKQAVTENIATSKLKEMGLVE